MSDENETRIEIQYGDPLDYGKTEAQILFILNENGLLLRNFTFQEIIEVFKSSETTQDLIQTIRDNRDTGLFEQLNDENSRGGELYIDGGNFEIIANNAEDLLENPERELINFLNLCGLI